MTCLCLKGFSQHQIMALAVWPVLAILVLMSAIASTGADSGFPAMFVFGDSLSDPGNNNNLVTLAKANFLPNGIDFPDGPTGRFCNGPTTVDYAATQLGLPLIPPYNNETTKGPKILKGVNYASGSAGILNDSGSYLGDRFTMDEQVRNFQQTRSQLTVELPKIGVNDREEFLAKSLFFVSIGSNDFLANYLLPASGKAILYTVDQFIDLLTTKFSKQLKDLYNLGGRRFLVCGIGALGCIPNQVGNFALNQSECFDPPNEMAAKYNEKLKPLLTQLKGDLPGANFVYGEIYFFTLNIINNPSQYGFKYTNKACCGIGRSRGQIQCLPELPLECRNRSEHMFWDAYHPTASLNKYAAQALVPLATSLLG